MLYDRIMTILTSVQTAINEPKIPFENVVEEFISARSLDLSPNTLTEYGFTFKRAVPFFSGKTIGEITPKDIRAFLVSFPGSRKSKRNAYIGLSSLWTFAVNNGYASTQVIRQVEPPKYEKRVIRPFTHDEVDRMLSCLGVNSVRDYSIILMFLDTGLRASELCGIKSSDICNQNIMVLGKGGKERYVPMSIPTMRALVNYLDERKGQPSKYIYLTDDGRPYNRDAMRHLFERLGNRAEVPNLHPHRFRHTFAINYLINGGDPYTLQLILGHSTMDMVKRYLDISQHDVQRVHAKASPVMNWMTKKADS